MTTTPAAPAGRTQAVTLAAVIGDLTSVARLARLPMTSVAGADQVLHIEVPTGRDVTRWATALMIDQVHRDFPGPEPGTHRTVLVVRVGGWTVHIFNITTPKATT